jgi:hypothetical protein
VAFYEKLIDLFSHISSGRMLAQRLKYASSPFPAGYNFVKTLGNRQMIGRFSEILELLRTNRQFRAFHEHETEVLPEFYHRKYDDLLGSYAALMPREERKPVLIKHEKRADVPLPRAAKVVIR